jgi:hypothetical protein
MSGYAALLSPLVYIFQWSLQPIAPFTWFGLGINTLDVLGAARLCLALRQLREGLYAEHVTKKEEKTASKLKSTLEIEEKSFMRELSTTLTVVYGGETMTGEILFSTTSSLN